MIKLQRLRQTQLSCPQYRPQSVKYPFFDKIQSAAVSESDKRSDGSERFQAYHPPAGSVPYRRYRKFLPFWAEYVLYDK